MIYADNAATTALSPAALSAMMPYLTDQYGNPSSLYRFGQAARSALERARSTVAQELQCRAKEVYFTSGGSESDSWAIKMAAAAMKAAGKTKIVTSAIEHHAVLNACRQLERAGFTLTLLPAYEDGIVRVEDAAAAITPDTALVSVMAANNEIGTIQPVAEIAALCRARGVLFHTDATQAIGQIPVRFADMGIDLLSLSAHKFHGPKGVGALLIRQGLRLGSLIDGGAQESGRRAGTENVAGVVGMAAALRESCNQMTKTTARLTAMRDKLIRDITAAIPRCRLNGDPVRRLPGNVNMSFAGIEGESLLLMLDMQGVCASSGSACTSGSLDPSHVLLAIGLPHEIAHGSLRLSFSGDSADTDADAIMAVLPGVVARLREMSPIWP